MDLRNLHICVQRFHHDPVSHKQIHTNTYSMAIFLKNSLWNEGDTINISFLPMMEDEKPEWYQLKDVAKALPPNELDIEKRARSAPSYADAVKLVVNEKVQPAVPKLNLKFVDSDGDVRVRFSKLGGSSSLIGTACKTAPPGEYTITFGWMDVGTIIHEFSHALGMLHEHQNPAGGIQWNEDAVYEWASETQGWDKETTYSNILSVYASNEITGSVFDSKSVMLYFFPAELTLNGQGTSQNLRYSDTDLQWLANTYHSTYVPKTSMSVSSPASSSTMPKWKLMLIIILSVIIVTIFILLFVL